MMNETVAILICTYNGEEYLAKQIESIKAQTFSNWTIYISDDGSTDETKNIIFSYIKDLGAERCKFIEGPRKGFAWNFINGLKRIPAIYNYYAFCDQDDIWLADKIDRSVKCISKQKNIELPAIYCSRTTLIDQNENVIGNSAKVSKEPSFKNSLIQCLAGGNTMLLNQAARNMLAQTPEDKKIPSHDWWVYLLVSGCGGTVIFDSEPSVMYRQHVSNLVGENRTISAKIKRIKILFNGSFRKNIDDNIRLLNEMNVFLSKENRELLNEFMLLRKSKVIAAMRRLIKIRPYRQNNIETILFFIALLLKRA